MSQQVKTPITINNEAEGSPGSQERLEPFSPFVTATVPAIQHKDEIDAQGATGTTTTVNVNPEGRDDDDAQDASLTRDETHPPASEAQTAPVTSDAERLPVLIVEDSQELAEIIQATLENMGLQSRHETHGLRGLATLKATHPRVVLLDIGLPDIPGWKMLEQIKQHYAQETVTLSMPTIVVITAYGDPANRLIGKLQNIHSYLIKPFSPDEIERAVSNALNGVKSADQPDTGADLTEPVKPEAEEHPSEPPEADDSGDPSPTS